MWTDPCRELPTKKVGPIHWMVDTAGWTNVLYVTLVLEGSTTRNRSPKN